MFYEEEAPGGFFEGSLEAVERQSALRSAVILENIDSLLYADEDDGEDEDSAGDAPRVNGGGGEEPAGEDAGMLRFDYDRHCGMGYSAHHDGVDAAELQAWRGRFHYLMARPAAMIEVEDDCPPAPAFVAAASVPAAPPPFDTTGADLCVVGKLKPILPPAVDSVGEDSDECVIALHGSIEEVIALDVTPPQDCDPSEGECSPRTSMRAEVVAGIFDALWPEVVEQLAPLVARVAALPPGDIQPKAVEESYGGCYESEW